jgi:NADP-dependent 3-hydroxy acid dehydrogenase YdfG
MPTIALVAAGARLGLSLGKTFGGHGFDVALIARSKMRLDELTGKLAAGGITATGFPADVTDRFALAAALDSAAERFGRIDVLHYSSPGAGTAETLRSTRALDVTVDNLDRRSKASATARSPRHARCCRPCWPPAPELCCTPLALPR